MKPPIHEDLARYSEASASSNRQFGFIVGLFLLAAGLWPLARRGHVRMGVLTAGAALVLIAAIAPILLYPLNRAWTLVGVMLGRVVNPVVMAALFYLIFTPVGLFLRMLGKDPLRLRPNADAASYWIERQPPGPPPETMANQF